MSKTIGHRQITTSLNNTSIILSHGDDCCWWITKILMAAFADLTEAWSIMMDNTEMNAAWWLIRTLTETWWQLSDVAPIPVVRVFDQLLILSQLEYGHFTIIPRCDSYPSCNIIWPNNNNNYNYYYLTTRIRASLTDT